MESKKIPKYIKEKCERMERLCEEARQVRYEVEKWCEKNGIDTCSTEWEESVRDEVGGCDAVFDINAIRELLEKNQ